MAQNEQVRRRFLAVVFKLGHPTRTMKLFQKLTTLLVPKKAEFAKRLAAKRLTCASNQFLASMATSGTTEYQLRVLGLESIEYAFTPEATVVNILEQYWKSHVRFMWNGPLDLPGSASEEARIAVKKRLNGLVGHIEYLLTKKNDAAVHLPEFDSLADYMRYRIRAEHPKNSNVSAEDGFTDKFFAYAVEESRFVFDPTGRTSRSGFL